MRTTTRLSLIAGAALAAPVWAQSFTNDSSISVPMMWRESTSSGGTVPNPDGALEAGEFALIWFDVSFTNQGGLAHFAPPIGTYSTGIVTGMGAGQFDIVGSGGTVGMFNINSPIANNEGTSGFGMRLSWAPASPGTVNAAHDGLINQWFRQLPANPGGAITENPIPRMLRFLWQPSDLTPRTARFDLLPSVVTTNFSASVYLDFGDNVGTGVFVPLSHLNLGSVSIPIAPAPPTLGLLALAGTLAAARRRRA